MPIETKEINPDLHREISLFSNYLKKHGLKITNQRLLVAEKIFNEGSHFTVDSLAESLKNRKGEISRATIYRIVSILVESGQLTEHNFSNNVKHYEHIPSKEHHDHIVCMDCKRIDEFIAPNIERLQIQIAKDHNYKLTDHSLVLYGKCVYIQKDEECPRKKQETSPENSAENQ